jgi:hypothetical protein
LGPLGQVNIGRVQAVKEIYFGSRVEPDSRHQILAKIQGTAIKAYMMDVNGYNHTWKPINKAAKPKKTLK